MVHRLNLASVNFEIAKRIFKKPDRTFSETQTAFTILKAIKPTFELLKKVDIHSEHFKSRCKNVRLNEYT